jgi:hypothetical protein
VDSLIFQRLLELIERDVPGLRRPAFRRPRAGVAALSAGRPRRV